jgi:hypothetical protein
MNSDIAYNEHMKETFRAMLDAITKREKKSVNVEVINKYTRPEFEHTTADTQKLIFSLLSIKYIRFSTFSEKRYYGPSKLGSERWSAYLGANLMEIQEEAERRMQVLNNQSPPWEDAR